MFNVSRVYSSEAYLIRFLPLTGRILSVDTTSSPSGHRLMPILTSKVFNNIFRGPSLNDSIIQTTNKPKENKTLLMTNPISFVMPGDKENPQLCV